MARHIGDGETSSTASTSPPLEGIDRRSFLMRHAVIGAAAVMTGTAWTADARAQQAAKEASGPKLGGTLSPDLNVVKAAKGPVMILADEFYKVGPGPSSSHTIGPMRITYDFYQRCTKLPADQLAQATGLKVHLFGSLSATGKGHGTERASLAGLLGKEPATVDPLFLDEMIAKPQQTYPVTLGGKTFNLSLSDVIYDAPKGEFPHPNTMTCKLMAGDKPVYELEYYSVGGGFIEWKGYQPPKKNPPKYPFATMKELRQHAEKNNLSIAQVIMANETSISGKSEADVNAFLDKIAGAMLATVKSGLSIKEGVLPGPIKLHSKAATVWERAMDDKYESDRAIGLLSACALAASEENARGHLVITAPTGGSAGVMPAVVYGLTEGKRKVTPDKLREGLLAGAGHRLSLQAQRHPGGCRRRLPVGDRRRLGDGRCLHGAGDRSFAAGDRERRRIGAGAPSRHDLRPGGGLRAGALHRALRLRCREGLDRGADRDQRDRLAPPRRSRHDDQDAGRHRQGHEFQVQGDERGRPGRQPGSLLRSERPSRRLRGRP